MEQLKIEQELEDENEIKQQQEELENANQQVSKQKSKKKKITNALFFVLNIVVVAVILIYQLKNEQVTSFSDLAAKGLNWWAIVPIFVLFALVMFFDALRTNMFVKKGKNRSRPFLSYKACVMGKYYDAITPMSTGGEAVQVFYFNKRGLDASSAISVPMARYVFSQLSWITVSFVGLYLLLTLGLAEGDVVSIASYIGLFFNFLILAVTLILSLSKKIGKVLVVKTLKFLQKIKIVKNYEKQYDRVMKVISGYQTTMSKYAKDFPFFIRAFFYSLLVFILNYSIPFFIYIFLGGTDYSQWVVIAVFANMIELAAGITPLPGGTGMSEISFTIVFASIFPEGTVFWGLILWRFMSYYIYLIQGLGVVIYDYAIGNKKYNWLKRKWELEAESVLFKEKQLREYKKRKKKEKSL